MSSDEPSSDQFRRKRKSQPLFVTWKIKGAAAIFFVLAAVGFSANGLLPSTLAQSVEQLPDGSSYVRLRTSRETWVPVAVSVALPFAMWVGQQAGKKEYLAVNDISPEEYARSWKTPSSWALGSLMVAGYMWVWMNFVGTELFHKTVGVIVSKQEVLVSSALQDQIVSKKDLTDVRLIERINGQRIDVTVEIATRNGPHFNSPTWSFDQNDAALPKWRDFVKKLRDAVLN